MNTDSYFETGTGHAICEDYALSGEYKGLYYAIGSDGCSSSDDTDTGARLLCHIAKRKIMNMHDSFRAFEDPKMTELEKILRILILQECKNIGNMLKLRSENFDATLWIATHCGRDVAVFGWGDGAVIKNCGELVQVTNLEYESNAPYYLSYGLSQERDAAYKKEYGSCYQAVSDVLKMRGSEKLEGDYRHERDCTAAFLMHEENALDGPMISLSVCSDGINTYQDKENNPITVLDIAEEYSAYKNYSGEFTKRRMLKIKKEKDICGAHHIDDIFCATVHIK